MDTLTENIHIKYTFNDKELLGLSRNMASAESQISELVDELKSVSTQIKAKIAEQEAVLHSCAEKLRSGYEMRSRECVVTYDSNEAIFADKETGEILEKRPITREEQLRLSGNRIDAEQVIRQANEEED